MVKKALKKVIGLPQAIGNGFMAAYYGVSKGRKVVFNGLVGIRDARRHTIRIGDAVTINSGRMKNPIGGADKARLISMGGSITIGDRCGISNATLFSQCRIVMEDDVFIGGGCCIYDTDFHSVKLDERLEDIGALRAPVLIKRGAWLGGHCIILKGVTIGENAVVGAGSVVTKDIPANEIWAGNPARFIRAVDDVGEARIS